ncbi:Nucleotide-binding universal stress protein, UspA family [Desulfocicer vacuolatum DSM 3385]|uniref:Nucleotide-binding universal stress protein, UspA family n=1 Tax=Desulfocicer vacuolatum DSM 3385 TaxID=1121400 RepID=A0A1W2AIF6_9BACT|nr:universal stress protein [Desulfocicer vacuolatum]SMC60221.1 Nucleotide-binding universal stress protein, UspA family [Desulfocicer vacuolatum DSM 3385]
MTNQIKKILYATDLSQAAPHFFQYALFLANQFNAHLTSLHVMEELSPEAKLAFSSYFGKDVRKELLLKREQGAMDEMKARVRRLCEAPLEGGEPIDPQRLTIKVTKGYPEEQILKISKEMDADLIVMGAHEKGFSQTFLGTVAKRVLRRSRIPVTVVPLAKK